MKVNKDMLARAFDSALDNGDQFVFVGVVAEGIKEAITIPRESMKAKKEFYSKAYNDDLVHVMNSNVRIFGFTQGDATAVLDLF